MKDQTLSPLVVFSLSGRHLIPAGLTYKDAEGCYKGECEPAYIMQASAFYASDLPGILFRDGQESLLYLDNQRGAWLRYGPAYDEPDQRYSGQWREIDAHTIPYLTAWTRVSDRLFAAF
ncbi:MAG TPA: hypothetical protein VD713_02540 [Sphingomonadales bacterium]|nr:hypothetical protein [Sphingomonadales bacterium]